jgi:AraC family transcriptional regulator
MEPRIIIAKNIKLVGICAKISLSKNQTAHLWKKFMIRKKEIRRIKNSWHYSVQKYDADLKMKNFNPDTIFESCAAVEVINFEEIPRDMKSFVIQKGTYAVFIHKGATDTFHKTADFIFKHWLPNSMYKLDNRMHFEIMKEEYLGPNNAKSQEEVWIPIK